ncbi:MAG: radical SAM protein [Myxococcota bacterium]|nr:radical SAM protein [Myxococcota bacterium]
MPKRIENGQIIATLTYQCDLSCRYCLRDAGPQKLDRVDGHRGEMPLELFGDILRLAASSGYTGISLTGGEVTRYPHLHAVLDLVRELGWRPWIETHGVFPSTDPIDQILARCSPSWVLISLDGQQAAQHDRLRGHGTFVAALRTAQYLVARGVPVWINAVVTPESFNTREEVIGFVQWAQGWGAGRVCFSRVVDSGRGIERGRWELDPYKKLWLRRLLDEHGMWDGFVTHLLHYKGDNWDCSRLFDTLTLSPSGFHPCVFQNGIVLAPLEAYREVVPATARGRQLNWFRGAALIEPPDDFSPRDAFRQQRQAAGLLSSEPLIYSCPECTSDFRHLVEQARGWAISDVELGPPPKPSPRPPDSAELVWFG